MSRISVQPIYKIRLIFRRILKKKKKKEEESESLKSVLLVTNTNREV